MNNGDIRESEDDALEDTRPDDMFHPLHDEDKLPEDNDSPAAPAQNTHTSANPQDPQSDDNLDADEIYSEGLAAAEDKDKIEEDSDNTPPKPLKPED